MLSDGMNHNNALAMRSAPVLMRNLLRMLLLGLSLLAPSAAFAVAGKVAALNGQITVAHASGVAQAVKVGDAVDKGDTVSAGPNSWAVLSMQDGASLTLRPNAKLRIDDYVFDVDNPKNGRSWLTLTQGALRSITGAIGRMNKDSYKLVTPTATIGIRGTDYDVDVVTDNSQPGLEPGTYHTVNAGGTTLKTQQGDIDVAPKQTAWTSTKPAKPRRMTRQQTSVWSDIGKFDLSQKISSVWDGLHARSGDGYTLDPDKLGNDGPKVRRYMKAHPENPTRRRARTGGKEVSGGLRQTPAPEMSALDMAGRKAGQEADMSQKLQHGQWAPGGRYFKPANADAKH